MTVTVLPEPDGKLRVRAGPVRLSASPLAAARRHFQVGAFSHRRKEERVSVVGSDTARITYKVGWGPVSTTVELLACMTLRERSTAVWFVCSQGLLPLAGQWRFEASEDGGCDLYLDQSVDARRVPPFVPLKRLLAGAIRQAIAEQVSPKKQS
jgi:hypothetical protein